jgi:putative iron-dependent peroxidase
MFTPQPGIFAIGTPLHHHVEFGLDDGVDPELVLPAVRRAINTAGTVAGVNVVVGFRPRLWAALAPHRMIDEVVDFEPVVGVAGYTMPATQRDLWLWVHSSSSGANLDIARAARTELTGVAHVVDEETCFGYGASQDLTGFEDGTENPSVADAPVVASVPAGRPGSGSSVVLVQRWVHDLDAFGALDLAQQEDVIGRTKSGSVELDDQRQPPTSHVSRVVVRNDDGDHDGADDGDELEVFRRSTPFGDLRQHGLLFVGFAQDQQRLARMLDRMAGVRDGIADRLTEFSTPTSGSWYIAPTLEDLS